MKVVLWILALTALGSASLGGAQDDHLEEHYGYVEVRPGAHMFWVMYHVDQPGSHTDYPLIMWLQGGPGASGVGYGNFEELGPYDINGNPREFAWTKKANVMFVDNPVGTGYSYVEDYTLFATDNAMIASDLVEVVKSAFDLYPDMQVMPFYVFAESYGGKMTVDFALEFEKAIKNGEVVSDFRGVALGDSWISPMDSVNTWGPFLYQMGFVNAGGEKEINDAAAKAQAAVDAGLWVEATGFWSDAEGVVMEYGNNVNFYNVLAKDDIYRVKEGNIKANISFMSPRLRKLYENHVAWQTRDALGDFMNGQQAEHWGIPDEVVWDSQGGLVFAALAGDFMKPVIDSVVKLLTETNLDVVVFTGNLDLICDTPGTYRWIENMEWPEKPIFMAAHNEPITISAYSATAATIQQAGRFSVYTIMRSGHMVPIDAPEMSLEMLDRIFGNKKQVKHQESQSPEVKVEETVKQMEEPKETPRQGVSLELEPKPQAKPHPKKLNLKKLKKEAIEKEVKKEEKAAKDKEEEESKKISQEEKLEKDESKRQEKPKKEIIKEKTSKERTLKEQTKKGYKKGKALKQENIVKKKAVKKEKVPEREMKQKDTNQKTKQEKYKGKETKSEQYKQAKVKKEEKKKQENEVKKENKKK